MKLIVSRQEIQAAMLFASTDQTRYVLNGVLFETKPDRQPLIVAVDGRRLCVIESDAVQAFSEEPIKNETPHSFILRADVCKHIVSLSRTFGGKVFPLICLENRPGSKRLSASILGKNITLDSDEGALIEGQFPNWRLVIPAKKEERNPVKEVGISAGLMADYPKAAKALESKDPGLVFNIISKDDAIEVCIKDIRKFYSIVMPYRIDDNFNFQSDFLKAA